MFYLFPNIFDVHYVVWLIDYNAKGTQNSFNLIINYS